jgi:ribosome-binding factor A
MKSNTNYSKQRTNSEIYRAFCIALSTRANNPSLCGAAVLRTELNADGSCVRVYLSADGDEAQQQKIFNAFKRSSGFFRTEIANTISLRRVPKLFFVMDRGSENAGRVEELLQQIHNGNQNTNDGIKEV